jgi:outer membrane protein, heavy metal efflux system
MIVRFCWGALAAAFVTGCASATPDRYHELRADLDRHTSHAGIAAGEHAAHDPFEDARELLREALIDAVLASNRQLEASRHALAEALAEVPRATALADPMLSYSVAPLSPLDRDARFGQEVMLSQTFPWPGVRRARGQAATAQAEASQSDYLTTRLDLALTAALLYDDYVRITRTLEINAVHLTLLDDAQASARAEYEAGRATLQDPLQAEVEASHLQHRQLALEGELEALIARINGLLHRDQAQPLPPPPSERAVPAAPTAPIEELVAAALKARTELEESEARIRAGEASLELARKDYYPNLGVSASYSTMWDHLAHRLMVGLSVNLPLARKRREAGVDQAQARIQGARAEREHLVTEITAEVVALLRRAQESAHVVAHYRDQILPASRDRVDAAHAAFLAGNLSFFAVVDALRALRNHELEYEENLATLYQRLAALDRAQGRIPGADALPGPAEELDHGH